jgi:hypothetical protein
MNHFTAERRRGERRTGRAPSLAGERRSGDRRGVSATMHPDDLLRRAERLLARLEARCDEVACQLLEAGVSWEMSAG